MKEINPEVAAWATTEKTNAILADIYDALALINANLVAVGSRKAAKQPKLYPRPGKKEPSEKRHYGRGALPKDELQEWFDKKRAEYASSSKRNLAGHSDTGGRTANLNN